MRCRLMILAFVAVSILLVGPVHFIRAAKKPRDPQPKDEGIRTPVLAELFTSEGIELKF
jgi:hypothetical protein